MANKHSCQEVKKGIVKMKGRYLLILLAVTLLTGCNGKLLTRKEKCKMDIQKEPFGTTADGEKVDLYTLRNTNGLIAKITNYGGIITELHVPDRNGKPADIVAGYESLEKYIENSPYFGALIGRYGNRIADGKFSLEGTEYTLAKNDGNINHLHGGVKGFDKVVWEAEAMETDEGPALKLTYLSGDGEEGYPGNLSCTVIYTLTNANELAISYEAETDKATVLNLTQHNYHNLAGHDSGDILGHELMLNAESYTEVNDKLIPTGEIKPVAETPMDFRSPQAIGSRIGEVKGGYDHNFVLNKTDDSLTLAARVSEPTTGRVMEVYTTEPGIQFYSGNFLDGTHKGKGAVYNKHNAFCLETQHFPDSPNQNNFPSVVLEPGETYRQQTVYKFLAK